MAHIITKYETTNTSSRWLVVGNYREIIGSHATADLARSAMLAIGHDGPDGLAETRWAQVQVVAPGETIAGELAYFVAENDPEDCDSLLDEMFGA